MSESPAVEAPVEAPTPAEAPAPSEQGEVKTESSNELPFGKHPRWIKLNEANKSYKQKIQELESKVGSLSSAEKLDQWLRQDPQRIKALTDMMFNKPQAQQDPYAGYDAETAQLLRDRDARIEAVERKLMEIEEFKNSQAMTSQERHKAELDSEFSRMLQDKGFVGNDGTVTEDNAPLIQLLEKATLAELMSISQNVDFPTKEELNEAFKTVTRGLEIAKRVGLKQVVTNPVPATGSKLGSPPSKEPLSDDDRIRRLASEWNGQI